MLRARMFPTRVNFPNRWSASKNCVYCTQLDTDEHLFQCSGYSDITVGKDVAFEMFFVLAASNEELSKGANVLMRILERLQLINEDKEMVK